MLSSTISIGLWDIKEEIVSLLSALLSEVTHLASYDQTLRPKLLPVVFPDICQYLLEAVFSNPRPSVHDTTQCTPTEVMFGRNIIVPVDLLFGHPEEEKEKAPMEYVAHLQECSDNVQRYARANIRVSYHISYVP